MSKIGASARDEACTLQIANVCNHSTETTVLAHIGFGDGGSAKRIQPNERNAIYACSSCHDWIDRRINAPEWDSERWFYIARALVRTAERRDAKGY